MVRVDPYEPELQDALERQHDLAGLEPSCSASSLEVHALGAVHANRCNNNELAGPRIGTVNNKV